MMLSDELVREIKELKREVNRLKLFDVPSKSNIDLSNSFGIWHSYTPIWTCGGGTCTLGNGTLEGRYCRINNLMVVHINFSWGYGASPSIVTGTYWMFSTPTHGYTYDIGIAQLNDINPPYNYTDIANFGPSGSVAPSSVSGEVAPFAWVPGCSLQIKIEYEAT